MVTPAREVQLGFQALSGGWQRRVRVVNGVGPPPAVVHWESIGLAILDTMFAGPIQCSLGTGRTLGRTRWQ